MKLDLLVKLVALSKLAEIRNETLTVANFAPTELPSTVMLELSTKCESNPESRYLKFDGIVI